MGSVHHKVESGRVAYRSRPHSHCFTVKVECTQLVSQQEPGTLCCTQTASLTPHHHLTSTYPHPPLNEFAARVCVAASKSSVPHTAGHVPAAVDGGRLTHSKHEANNGV